ncbi:MAG TPA: ribosome silencing factor, partial [Acetobacteraceae bacterium]|nr:ribosome silencing factor [Acetobacteraceae bacterium]
MAGPKPTRARKPEPSLLDAMQATITESLAADKAEDIVTLDLNGRASFADR